MHYDRRDDIHEVFLGLACKLICLNCLDDRLCKELLKDFRGRVKEYDLFAVP
jgi:hypothetical protein